MIRFHILTVDYFLSARLNISVPSTPKCVKKWKGMSDDGRSVDITHADADELSKLSDRAAGTMEASLG